METKNAVRRIKGDDSARVKIKGFAFLVEHDGEDIYLHMRENLMRNMFDDIPRLLGNRITLFNGKMVIPSGQKAEKKLKIKRQV